MSDKPKTKSALLFWGGWEGHEPQKGAELFPGFSANAVIPSR